MLEANGVKTKLEEVKAKSAISTENLRFMQTLIVADGLVRQDAEIAIKALFKAIIGGKIEIVLPAFSCA